MYYPFQFSTVITLFAAQINDGFSEYDLFFSIFDSIIDSMPEKEFRIPSGTTISRWFTGERTVPAALVKRCKAPDAPKLIENEIKAHAFKHFADVPKLIYQILKLIREDTNYTAQAREQLLSYNPAMEDNHASFLTEAILAALMTNQNIPFQKDSLLKHLLSHISVRWATDCLLPDLILPGGKRNCLILKLLSAKTGLSVCMAYEESANLRLLRNMPIQLLFLHTPYG